MFEMFADYQSRVILAYQKKRDANALSLNLIHSTPAKLKAECMAVCNERYLKRDEKVLRLFFGLREDASAYMQAIKQCEADKFKPLYNFLKGNTNKTEEKNIELLAWLINLEPRPYKFGQINAASEVSEGNAVFGSEGEGQSNGTTDVGPREIVTHDVGQEKGHIKEVKQERPDKAQPIKKKSNGSDETVPVSKVRNIIILFTILVLVGGGTYLILRDKRKTAILPYTFITGRECMYWTGDHYQPISCNQKIGDTAVFALDSIKLVHFKRITEPDTITRKSLGEIWYVKVNGNVEFYTSVGFHPIYTERRLRPLTDYILNKYVLRK